MTHLLLNDTIPNRYKSLNGVFQVALGDKVVSIPVRACEPPYLDLLQGLAFPRDSQPTVGRVQAISLWEVVLRPNLPSAAGKNLE